MVEVEDDEIVEAIGYTGRLTGVFAEPAAATAVAGLRRAVRDGVVGRRQSALAMITGNGLKDTGSARSAVGKPFEVMPDGMGLKEILRGRGLIG
jgi:threonine synthase